MFEKPNAHRGIGRYVMVSSSIDPPGRFEDIIIELGYLGRRISFIQQFLTEEEQVLLAAGRADEMENLDWLLEIAMAALDAATSQAGGEIWDFGDYITATYPLRGIMRLREPRDYEGDDEDRGTPGQEYARLKKKLFVSKRKNKKRGTSGCEPGPGT
jgi:hypothetical protein